MARVNSFCRANSFCRDGVDCKDNTAGHVWSFLHPRGVCPYAGDCPLNRELDPSHFMEYLHPVALNFVALFEIVPVPSVQPESKTRCAECGATVGSFSHRDTLCDDCGSRCMICYKCFAYSDEGAERDCGTH